MSSETQTAVAPETKPASPPAKPKHFARIDRKLCKVCGICVKFCPVANLTLRTDHVVIHDKCIGCRQCERYCPDMAISVHAKEPSATASGQ
ncbi:MAG: 4Fe-4S dicluster domain-containing protein [Planctomycetes bacterium]|nr:4Fe-4S dicluster domain-containing protein [Planctomycetota bacterium]MBM4085107.1 4Fe-4S dicluster domain-containing protein [Planctomycetota bacterium]